VDTGSAAFWETDQDFDLDWHIRLTALPGAAGKTELQRLVSQLLANDNVCMRVELGNELKQRIENIERGVTSPAQLVPDMLKRVQALEAKVTRLDNEAAHYRGFEPNKKGKT
jgi:hypothetical protein